MKKSKTAFFSERGEKCGFLKKKGGVQGTRKWQKRFFVLIEDSLSYYAKHDDTEPKGLISLTNANLVEKSCTKRALGFQIVTLFLGNPQRVCDTCKERETIDDPVDFWVPDDLRQSCPLCQQKFNALVRKHHCRACGMLICGGCSKTQKAISCTRTFYLEAETPAERDDWLTTLRAKTTAGGRKPILRSGFLNTHGTMAESMTVAPGEPEDEVDESVQDTVPKATGKGIQGWKQKAQHQARKVQQKAGGLKTKAVRKIREKRGRIQRADQHGWCGMYYVLTEGELSVYARIKDHLPPETPFKTIDLRRARLVPFSCLKEHSGAFQLFTEADDTRPWHLDILEATVGGAAVDSVLDESTSQDWIWAIAEVMPRKVFDVDPVMGAERSDPDQLVPAPVQVATNWLNDHGCDEVGLYRIPGSKAEVDRLVALFDSGVDVASTLPKDYPAANFASLLVQYIRRLPNGLFAELGDVFQKVCADEEEGGAKQLHMLKKLLGMLKPAYYQTLWVLVYHWTQVTQYAESNHMTAAKLSMCVYSQAARPVQLLIEHYDTVFGE